MTLGERITRYLEQCEPAMSGEHGHDVERGIEPPLSSTQPKTLDHGRAMITDLEQQLVGATANFVPPLEAKVTSPAPPPKTTESIAAKARAFLAKPPAQSSGRLDHEANIEPKPGRSFLDPLLRVLASSRFDALKDETTLDKLTRDGPFMLDRSLEPFLKLKSRIELRLSNPRELLTITK
jgi:hypothetical protein